MGCPLEHAGDFGTRLGDISHVRSPVTALYSRNRNTRLSACYCRTTDLARRTSAFPRYDTALLFLKSFFEVTASISLTYTKTWTHIYRIERGGIYPHISSSILYKSSYNIIPSVCVFFSFLKKFQLRMKDKSFYHDQRRHVNLFLALTKIANHT